MNRSLCPNYTQWQSGIAPIAVVMISLNEGHNMEQVLQNLLGWAHEVFLVDSFSCDNTVDIALRYGVFVVQRHFTGFGDQWNFAMLDLPITAPWTMKLDPDERLTDRLKASIITQIAKTDHAALLLKRRLWFMGKQLPIYQKILRIWKTGTCRFSDVLVNEYPLVDGVVTYVDGDLEHHDSPDLHHWVDKQNRYSSVEAIARYRLDSFAATPKLFGSSLERRMWFKKHFFHFPLRYQILLIANLIRVQPWRSGREGLAWARLRVWVWRMREDKLREMRTMGREIELPIPMLGRPHPHAIQANS